MPEKDKAIGMGRAIETAWQIEEAGGQVPKTLFATAQRTELRWLKQDLVEIQLETMDLEPFRRRNGKLKRRPLARVVQAYLMERNARLEDDSTNKTTSFGLRTLELIIQRWEESENT